MKALLREISRCVACAAALPHTPRPVVAASASSRIIIIGQAPGRKVHATGIPWNDPSGDTLRAWLNVDKATFYDTRNFALMPMGFCYPGKGRSGDLPPRQECAPLWHDRLRREMRKVQLTLLVGQYSHAHYLGKAAGKTLAETVRRAGDFLPEFLPLPHPSPRNRLWLRKNAWFEAEVVPLLRERVKAILNPPLANPARPT